MAPTDKITRCSIPLKAPLRKAAAVRRLGQTIPALRLGFCAVVLALTAACQTQSRNGYADLVNRPLPTSDAQRDSQCAWLRSEVARQQSLGQLGASMQQTPQMAIAYQAMARRNIAYLQSRFSQIQCDVVRVAPTPPVVAPAAVPTKQQSSEGMTLDECFKKCRELTAQTEAQCFDECRH
jgi:hypothetical protein